MWYSLGLHVLGTLLGAAFGYLILFSALFVVRFVETRGRRSAVKFALALLSAAALAADVFGQTPADDLLAAVARLEAAQVRTAEVLVRLDARVSALEGGAPRPVAGTAEADSHKGVKMVKLRGDTYKLFPDGRLEWCEECNGRPDPNGGGQSMTAPAPRGAEDLTYDQAYWKALREGKPLVVWVGGNFCPQCVKASESDFVHAFVPSFPGVTEPQAIVVGVADGGTMLRAGDVTWWVTGDKEFGHLPSIRNAIRRWRERRAVARESGTYQARAAATTRFVSMPAAAVATAPVVTSAPVRFVTARAGACASGR